MANIAVAIGKAGLLTRYEIWKSARLSNQIKQERLRHIRREGTTTGSTKYLIANALIEASRARDTKKTIDLTAELLGMIP